MKWHVDVQILGCECIEYLIDELVKESNSDQLSSLFRLLEEILTESDDIDCGVISVFNLLISMTKHDVYADRMDDFLNLEVTLPFNFHR